MSFRFTESVVEDAALAWLGEYEYSVLHEPQIAPGETAAQMHHDFAISLSFAFRVRPR